MDVLVTGASGLVGSHLVPALAREHRVVAVARRAQDAANVRGLRLDLDADWSQDALPPRIDAVVHLAQSLRFREFPAGAESMLRVNVVATARLLEWAARAGARTFVLASSGGVYGARERPFTEADPVGPSSDLGFYLGTRVAAEALATGWEKQLSVVRLRFFFVYGPGQPAGMLLPRLVKNVREGAPLQLQGQDGLRLNPVHATDAARAVERALGLGRSAVVNVAGPDVLTLRQVGEAIGRAVGRAPRFEVDERAAPRHCVGDTSRMAELLGAPTVRFEQGLATIV